MRSVVCTSFAPLDQLAIVEQDSPALGPGQIRVAVRAAGVNFVDALIVQGLYQVKPPLPFVPGGESVGVVTEIADDVTTPAVGQRVLIGGGFGCFTTEMVVPASRATLVPANLSDGQAATFLQSYATAYFALHERGRLQPGQSLLVLGAGGGVGLGAVDVGTAMGLRVIAAASSADKRELATSRGAVAVIDSTSEDVKVRARELAGGGGVEAVYDPIGGEVGEQCLRALDEDGQFLVVGFASGAIPQLPANHVLLRNRRVTGVDWGGWVGRHQQRNSEMLAELFALVESGAVHPVEPHAYAFHDAAVALSDQQNRRVAGKAVLVVDEA